MHMFKTAIHSQKDSEYLTLQNWRLPDFCILVLVKIQGSLKSLRMSVTVHKNEYEENSQYLTEPLNLKALAVSSFSLRAYHSLVTAQAFTPVLLPLINCQ